MKKENIIKEVAEVKKIIGYECDLCGDSVEGEYPPESWHNIEFHHQGWGNDNIESYIDRDVCPNHSLVEVLDSVKSDYEQYPGATVELSYSSARTLAERMR